MEPFEGLSSLLRISVRVLFVPVPGTGDNRFPGRDSGSSNLTLFGFSSYRPQGLQRPLLWLAPSPQE